MKRLGKFFICFILCVVALCLCACNRGDSFYQSSAGANTVIGNGGLAVQADEYLYFVNGYISASNQTEKNATYTVGSLMVAKMENGNLVFGEDGYIEDSYLRTMSSKLSGFEATGLYVFGEYLYFTSPCQEDVRGSGWAKERVDFYRIRLDMSSDVERIYQSNVDLDSLDYEYYYDGTNVVLLVVETGDNTILYRVNASNGDVETVSESISSYYLGRSSNSNQNAFNTGYAFYVETQDNGYNYTLFNPLSNLKSTKLETSECEVLYVNENRVYYTTTLSNELTQLNYYTISNNTYALGGAICAKDDPTFAINDDGYVFVNSGTSLSMVATPGNKNLNQALASEETEITIIGYANGCVIYYDGANNIKYTSYASIGTSGTLITDENMSTSYFSISNNYVYYYSSVNETEYLFRVSVHGGDAQMIGVYDEEDIPEEDETEDETESEEEI